VPPSPGAGRKRLLIAGLLTDPTILPDSFSNSVDEGLIGLAKTLLKHPVSEPRDTGCSFVKVEPATELTGLSDAPCDRFLRRSKGCGRTAKRSGAPYISPMTRRLKCRIDPEQSTYTCALPAHRPVRRGAR
jgi:hypothetical protein